ncbi:MAG TPA: hypothetical protein VGO96_09435, partial [Pyrinomonadaceae bacterium]|nr:hypothetical protein [Pyrinomonadaceae bacterium]
PVSFTGRDEDISDDDRARQRYTLSHLAHDVKTQVGITEPTRDWFPLSLMGAFADFADLVHGPEAEWGQVSCGCHPNCGVGTAVMINKNTKEMKPVPEFLNIPGLVKDMTGITDAGRGKWFSNIMMGLALLKNYQPYGAPQSLTLVDIFKKFDKSFGLSGKSYGKVEGDRTFEDIEKRRSDPWNFLFIAGMWFQDLFNYDFRRTEMCIIPYGTQEGEISFCAYNTGIGWRNIIEQMHQNATIAKWYKEHGRHEIFAKGKNVELNDAGFTGILNEVDLQRPNRPEMAGPKTAAEEAAMMRKLYQEMVLKQKLGSGDVEKNTPVQIKGLGRSKDAVSA